MNAAIPRPTRDVRILITGGARGIGRATAEEFVSIGAKVFITDVLEDEGRETAEQLGSAVAFARHDVTDPAGWQDVLIAAERFMGGVNALFNNAGIVAYGSTATHDIDEFRRVVDVNLVGVHLGMKHVVPFMKKSGGGVIVNCSSTAGLQGYANIAGYVASKWAVRGLTKAAALDLSADGIRVLSLHPGPIRTPMTSRLDESVAAEQPIARFGEAAEVARMVRFMVVEATYSTGSEFIVDGGAVTGRVQPLSND